MKYPSSYPKNYLDLSLQHSDDQYHVKQQTIDFILRSQESVNHSTYTHKQPKVLGIGQKHFRNKTNLKVAGSTCAILSDMTSLQYFMEYIL